MRTDLFVPTKVLFVAARPNFNWLIRNRCSPPVYHEVPRGSSPRPELFRTSTYFPAVSYSSLLEIYWGAREDGPSLSLARARARARSAWWLSGLLKQGCVGALFQRVPRVSWQ